MIKPIKILKVKDDDSKMKLKRDMPEHLPQNDHEILLIVAPICCGKSNFISNWYLNPELAHGLMDTIYIFSNTINQDSTSRFLKDEPNVVIFDNLTPQVVDDAMTSIIAEQSQHLKKDQLPISIVFDDIIGTLPINSSAWSIASRARHYGIRNIFYLTQKFRAINNVVRNNTTHLILFAGIFNDKELNALNEEYSIAGNTYPGGLPQLYKDHIQKERFNFLYSDLGKGKTYKNFDKMLVSAFDSNFNYEKPEE